ncbi:MAG: NAD-binding protein [Desulfobulbus sp.]|jgi:Trk K+ transport system NAD-binding subunit|uniref:potassium channel family protein n=1 Tax=Desulfobulbus sp. TaxID=895 RepID=UPI0028505D25|nr:NAD-binding protein [Desulfobulbus sp.]MDR2550429.1 NAD-binding protein [Desulfobulbus sp.]
MKYLASQFLFLLQDGRARRNIRSLVKFTLFLVLIMVVYSYLFHVIMAHEGRDYSAITGLYWTLTVMSTLGFGDITFDSDLGKLFSIVVLLSGIIFLLVMLPFTFIQFFYAPWLEAQNKSRVPRHLPAEIGNHVIITCYDPIAIALVQRLKQYGHEYILLVPEVQQALDLVDQGYKVLVGELDDSETYRRAHVERAALVVALNDDMKNTSIVYTVREIAPQVPIVANADLNDSVDILVLAGCSRVFQFMNMLGRSLARRTLGARTHANVIGRFEDLVIAEALAMRTHLVGKTVRQLGLRQATGITIVGLWNRGHFTLPRPETVIESSTVLVLAGAESQLADYGTYIGETETTAASPALILGGGRVGKAAVSALQQQGVAYRIVEKNRRISEEGEYCVIGSAADHQILIKAGIETAPSVFITTHNDDVNIYLTIYCRRLRPDIQIISRATLDRNINVLHAAGADLVMSHASMAANTIINILTPGRVLMLTEGLNIFRCRVHLLLIGKSLLNSGIRESTGCSVIAIFRQGHRRINPDPSEILEPEDELLMIGTAASEKAFAEKYPDT